MPTPDQRVQQAQVDAAKATVDAAGAARSSAAAARFSAIAAGAMVAMAVVTAVITLCKDPTINVQSAEPKVVVIQPPAATQPADEPEPTTQPSIVP